MTLTARDTARTPRAAAPAQPDVLRRVRRVAARARASARLDLFGACAMLATDRQIAGRACLDTLLRTLEQGLGRAPVIYCETCPQLSFDERWILALLDAHRRGDRDSSAFLLCSRLPRAARRHVAFLIAGVAQSADAAATHDRMTA